MATTRLSDKQSETSPLLSSKLSSGSTLLPNGSKSTDERTEGPSEVTGKKLLILLIGPWLGSFLAALDTTMTSTMSASMSESFGSLALIGWLGSSYLIANAAVQPLSGKLTDIFGRRAGLLFCCTAFIAGNLICGLANSSALLVVGRAIAGIGGGGLNSICTFVASDVVPTRKRGYWQGLGMLLYGTGVGLGGVFGGAINNAIGWRWAFLLLCPVTAVVALIILFAVPASLPHLQQTSGDMSLRSRIRRIDFLGSFLLVSALIALLFALDFDTPHTPDTTPAAITLAASDSKNSHVVLATCLPLSILLFLLFAFQESRATHPILALPLLANKSVLCASLAMASASVTTYTLMFHVPLFFQARGESSSTTGALLVPEAVGISVGCLGSGALMRYTGDYKYLKPGVLLVFLAGAGGFSTASWTTPVWAPEFYLFANGLGFGGMLTTLLVGMIAAIDHSTQAVATGACYAFRTVGASVGVAASNALFRKVLESKGEGLVRGGLSGLPVGGCRGDGAHGSEVCGQYAVALRAAFSFAFGFAVLAAVLGALMPGAALQSSFRKPDHRRVGTEHEGEA